MNYDFECLNPDCAWTGNRYANLKKCPECGAKVQRMMTVEQEQDAEIEKLREQIALLETRLHEAVFLKAGDKVGFDFAVLDRMAKQEEEIARLKKQFQKCRDYLKEALILNPADNWQWGYRAAVLGMADSLLFGEPKPPEEPTP